MPVPLYLFFIRLTIPFFILKWPLWGILAASLADMYDWKFINIKSQQDFLFYQNWDKAMDMYYWIFALVIILKWKDKLAQKLTFGLFFYRAVGIMLFYLTKLQLFLFLFPNIFEDLVIFYLIFASLFKKHKLFTSVKITTIVLAFLIVPKLIHEYFLHFLGKQPWELYNVGRYFGLAGFFEEYTNYFVFGGLLYIIPFVIGLFWIKNLRIEAKE